jgi:hypothetical protein
MIYLVKVIMNLVVVAYERYDNLLLSCVVQ